MTLAHRRDRKMLDITAESEEKSEWRESLWESQVGAGSRRKCCPTVGDSKMKRLYFFLRAMGSHWKLYGEKRHGLICMFKNYPWDSPRGPVAETLWIHHSRAWGFHPWSGEPRSWMLWGAPQIKSYSGDCKEEEGWKQWTSWKVVAIAWQMASDNRASNTCIYWVLTVFWGLVVLYIRWILKKSLWLTNSLPYIIGF